MSQLTNKFICLTFLISYSIYCLAMEESTEKKGNFGGFFSRNTPKMVPYDDNEKPDVVIGVREIPIFTEEHILEHVPFIESIDQLEIDPPSVTIMPSQPSHEKPIEQKPQAHYEELPKAPHGSTNNQSHSASLSDLLARNKRENDYKNSIQYNQSPIDPLALPPGPGGTIGYDQETLEGAIEYNKKQANQGRRINNTQKNIPAQERQIAKRLTLEEVQNKNFREEIFARISHNYHDEKFMSNFEKTLKDSNYYDDFVEVKAFIDKHPEMIGDRNYWSKDIRYKPTYEAPQKQPKPKIESNVSTSTVSTTVQSSNDYEFSIQNPGSNNTISAKNYIPHSTVLDSLRPYISEGPKNYNSIPNRIGSSSSAESNNVEIDESEFENLKMPSDHDTHPKALQTPSSMQRSVQSQRQNIQRPKREFRETPSFPGLDNNEWPEHRLEEQRAQRRAAQLAKKRSRNVVDLLANYQETPSDVKDTLQDIIKEDRWYGSLNADQIQERIKPIVQEYKNILHKLRIQEKPTREQIELRRALEDELLTQEERTLVYDGALQQINRERQRDIDENINFWHAFSRFWGPDRLKELNEKYDARKEEYRKNALDSISESYKKEYHDKQKQEEDFKRLQEEKAVQRQNRLEHQRRVQKINKTRKETDRAFKEQGPRPSENCSSNSSTTFLTFSDSETIIAPDAYDPTINLDGIDPSSVDFVVTSPSNDYLLHMGIDPDEFINFKGRNAKQNEIHHQLSNFVNKNINDPISNFIFTNDSELAIKIREIHENVFKAAYALNTRNYTELAQEMVSFLANFSTFSVLPIRTIAIKSAMTILHPMEYIQERLNSFYQLAQVVGDFCIHIEPFLFNPSATESLVLIKKGLDKGTQIISKMIQDNLKLTLREREKLLAGSTVNLFVDGSLAKTLSYIAKISASSTKIPTHLPYIDVTIESIAPMSPSPAGFAMQFDNPTTRKAIEGLITRTSQIPNVAHPGISVQTARNPFPVLPDFSQVIPPNYASKKLLPKRTKPYSECKKALSKELAAKRGMAKTLADAGEKNLLRNNNGDPENNELPSLSRKQRINYAKPGESKLIREFTNDTVEIYHDHIFSKDHKKNGIMNLGATEEIIREKFVEFIVEADKAGLMQLGDNTMHTVIHGHETIIKARITQDGIIQSMNGYLKTSKNAVSKGNSFTFYLEKYK